MTIDFTTLPRLKIVLAEPAKKPEPETVPFKDVPVGARFFHANFAARFAERKVLGDDGIATSLQEGEGWDEEGERWQCGSWGDDSSCILLLDDPAEDAKPTEPEAAPAVPFEELPAGCVFRFAPDRARLVCIKHAGKRAVPVGAGWPAPYGVLPDVEHDAPCIPLAILEHLDPAVLEQGERGAP